jgi:ABC-type sugar transport system permease subunit
MEDKRKETKKSQKSATLWQVTLRLLLLLAIDGFVIWFAMGAFAEGYFQLGVVVALLGAGVNYVILAKDLYPIRWMLIGLIFMSMFAIWPILLTVFVAFTNYGDGHLLTKQQSINLFLQERYLPEGSNAYTWTGYINDNDEYALWLQNEAGESYLAYPGETLIPAEQAQGLGELDDNGIPASVGDYKRLNAIQVATNKEIVDVQFGTDLDGVRIRSAREAAQLEPKFEYDLEQDVLINHENAQVYSPQDGTWTSNKGDRLSFGFRANVGLIIAYIYNDRTLPGRKIIQSFLLIPYTIPSLITIIIWRGMFNNEYGVINRILESLFHIAPAWTVEPNLAKIAILIVNLWLGYLYFMLITSGALQAIPEDLYEAASIDGANGIQKFFRITLPMLLVSVGPLLVASFVYNFNNFNLIFLFIEGGPPIPNSPTRAGYTDILISYVYNFAFAAGRAKEYGLGAAITIIIFIIVAVITLLQFKYTRMWEEVGENA